MTILGGVVARATMNRLVSCTALKACALWEGSEFESAFKYSNGVTVGMVADKASKLMKCDDRTPKEEEWLTAMLAVLKEQGIEPVPGAIK